MTVYEITLNYSAPSGIMQNVLHYDFQGTEPFDFQAAADVIRVDFVDNLASIIAPAVSLTGITVREDVPGSIGQTYGLTLGDAPGTSTDNQFGAVLSAIVQKKAENLQRPNKGRIYQGGITSEGLGSFGNWSQAVLDACDAFWADMRVLSIVGPSTGTMVIKASKPTNPNTVAYNPVATLDTLNNPGTQRRRRRGVGI